MYVNKEMAFDNRRSSCLFDDVDRRRTRGGRSRGGRPLRWQMMVLGVYSEMRGIGR